MLMQAVDLVRYGYPYVSLWPWTGTLILEASSMTEPEAMEVLADRIGDALDCDLEFLRTSIICYIERSDQVAALLPQAARNIDEGLDAGDVIRDWLMANESI